MVSFLGKMFTNGNERELKKLWPIVDEVNALEAETQKLSDDELQRYLLHLREERQLSSSTCNQIRCALKF